MKTRDPTARYSLLVMTGYVALVVLIFAGWQWFKSTDSGNGHALSGIFSNLRVLQGAKEQWALEWKQTNGALPTPADLTPYLKGGEFPIALVEETYVLNPVGELVEAKLSRKIGVYEANEVLTVTNF